MKKTALPIVLIVLLALGVVLVVQRRSALPSSKNHNSPANVATTLNVVPESTNLNVTANTPSTINGTTNASVKTPPMLVMPLKNFYARVTKKPFGIQITPETSPVQPEKFHGYHTGVDAEVSQDEGTKDVPVYAIADGTVTLVSYLRGYGGVVMIRHMVDGETVTALYGHVRQSSVAFSAGDTVHAGDRIALLGSGYTPETQNERKHLHFGLLKGASKDTRGYVNGERGLGPWLDAVLWLQERNAHDPRG